PRNARRNGDGIRILTVFRRDCHPLRPTTRRKSNGGFVQSTPYVRQYADISIRSQCRTWSTREDLMKQSRTVPETSSEPPHAAPQHFLYFLPLPQGQGSLRPTLRVVLRIVGGHGAGS